ncbi:13654_t:CDS:2, partial [Ambispora gerdemannii]
IMTNPSVEQNLLKEINSLITPTNPFPDYDSINNLPYSLATLNETLRLHPAVPRNFKTVVEDDTLPGGVPVYSGDMIFWVPYSMGRDERVWGKDVDEFKPTRFLKSGKFVRQSPYKLIAFNAGPRVCLGQEFATVQALTLLSVMLKDFHFELLTSEKLIKYRPSITLQMKHPLMVKVTRRE